MKLAILAILALDAALWLAGLMLDATITLVVVGFVGLAIVQAWRTVGGAR